MTDLFLPTESDRAADTYRCKVDLAQRGALAPLRPTVPQRPLDIGLFSDDAAQLDLVKGEHYARN